jgi:ACS family hexuronate transporter-like MFS transporter
VSTPSSQESQRPTRARWVIVALLFAAIVLSYVDRQTIGLLKGPMSEDLGWTNSDFANIHIGFQAAYALCYLLWGRVVDRIGARVGLALSFLLWSLAQIAIGGATRVSQFMLARAALGAGESGALPAAVKAIVEWFPQRERSFATGLFNSGSNVGAILTPLAIPAIALAWGWQMAFVVTGIAGLLWLPLWLALYRTPRLHPFVNPAELAWIESDRASGAVPDSAQASWRSIMTRRQSWAYACGKAFSDPVFGMYLVWLPDFLAKRHHLDLRAIGWPLAAIYLMSDVGSVAGGWLSSHWLRRGASVNAARKNVLALCAACATPVVFAASVDELWLSVLIVGVAAAAHQGFSATLLTLPGDLMPRRSVGAVAGLGGLCGAGAGMAMSKYTGFVLDNNAGYLPVFLVAGSAYWVALGLIHILSPRLQMADEDS